MRPTLLALLLTACGAAHGPDTLAPYIQEWRAMEAQSLFADDVTGPFEVPCLGPVDAGFQTSRLNLAENLAVARDVFDSHGVLPFGDFCGAFDDVPLRLVDEFSPPAYDKESGIRLGHSGWLVAGLLEHLKATRGDLADAEVTSATNAFASSKELTALWVQP